MLQDDIYINMAKEYSRFSKCQFTKVGAIAINENKRIVATGVNGTIPGEENCCEHTFEEREDHVEFTRDNELHAETNLILELATSSVTYTELSIYLTISPCHECVKALLGLARKGRIKIDRIVYAERYHRLTEDDIIKMKSKASAIGCKFYQHEEESK